MKPFLLIVAFSAMLAAQTVEGDVVDALTGAPVEGAYVSTYSADAAVARTDAAGHFRLPGLTPGRTLSIARTGYLRRDWTAPGTSDQGASAPRIAVTPEAVIAGKLEDKDGFPVERANVEALRYYVVNGERRLLPAGFPSQSDDLGRYRIAGLPAGRYHIRVTPWDLSSWDSRYVPLFCPGTLQPDDTKLIDVEAGQEYAADMRLTKFDGVSVAGTLLSPDGAPAAASISPFLTQPGTSGSFRGSRLRDGGFIIRHVPPGNYILRASSAGDPPRAGDLLVKQPLQVGSSGVRDLVVTLHEAQPVDLPGTVVHEGGGNPPPMTIGLITGNGVTVVARSNEDGSFVLKGLLPGYYRLEVQPDFGAATGPIRTGSLVSARLGDQELRGGFDLDAAPLGPLRITVRPAIRQPPR